MDTNRGIWEDEKAFLGLFKGVAKGERLPAMVMLNRVRVPEPRLFHFCDRCDLLRKQLSQSQTLSRAQVEPQVGF